MKDIFSLPINPKGDLNFTKNVFVPFLKRNKHLIYDLYFTCRIPPFSQDAMGDIFENDPVRGTTINALWISEQSGIPLSATFNNMWVRPDQKNLNIWIENFKPLYDKGIRIVTLPHTTWVSTGQIQKEYPELFIKNTILREVTRANEVVALAKAGFHYVNLDRDLMRDHQQLKEIKRAKEYCERIGKPIKLSMLVNETCWGGCPIMPEHYHYNSTRTGDDPIFFASPISRVSCSTWDVQHPEYDLKQANLPPWKRDWEEMLDLGIDVFKLHGRESAMRLQESMDLIERWANNEEYMFPEYKKYQAELQMKEAPINMWREKIKTCKFDCWDCNYCEAVVDSHMKKADLHVHPHVETCIDAFENSGKYLSNHTSEPVPGLTSPRVRHFLNNICSQEGAVYLEIGVFAGSTFCAAIENNDMVAAYANDTWQEPELQPEREDLSIDVVGDMDTFISNVEKVSENLDFDISVLKGECEGLNKDNFQHKVNIIFYDGDNDPTVMWRFFNTIDAYTDDVFTLIIDDANSELNVKTTKEFVNQTGWNILYERELLNNQEDENMWWNGLYVLVLSK